jgi:nucleoside-triphosphatase THEP1
METNKDVEEFEEAVIEALRNGVISIDRLVVDDLGNSEISASIHYPCPNILI